MCECMLAIKSQLFRLPPINKCVCKLGGWDGCMKTVIFTLTPQPQFSCVETVAKQWTWTFHHRDLSYTSRTAAKVDSDCLILTLLSYQDKKYLFCCCCQIRLFETVCIRCSDIHFTHSVRLVCLRKLHNSGHFQALYHTEIVVFTPSVY